MKRKASAFILAFLISSFFIPLGVEAQPSPPNVKTLGPVVFSYYPSGNVVILSLKNSTYYVNPIQLNFTVEAVGMLGQFGNVGVSIDGGIINSVTDFINKLVVQSGPDWYWYRTTVLASVMLPTLSEGTHNVTVYYGWQYLGTNNPSLERYEVFAYETIDFAIGKPTIMPPTISVSSPENNLTTEANSIPLIFNISAPTAVMAMQSQLRYAYYEADWLSERQYLYHQNLSSNEHFQSLQLNTTLSNIPNGTHKLLIVVGGSVTIKQAMFVEEFDSENNSTIIFNVQPTDILVLNQTQIISIVVLASVAVVGIGLLVYFKKRKR